MAKGNIWYAWPGAGCEEGLRLNGSLLEGKDPYDVAIVGAGVVGCALAYRLSQYQLRVALLDKHFDVGEGTSKANSAIIHTGFDAAPESLESRLLSEAWQEWPRLAERLKIPFRRCSALVVATDEDQAAQVPRLHEKALANGVDEVEVLGPDRVLELEPNVTYKVRAGLLVANEAIVDPFTTCVAYAEVALENGVDILLGAEVVGIDGGGSPVRSIVLNGGQSISARFLVNAAGLGSRRVADQYAAGPFDINPRRGQFLVYDRESGSLIRRILLPIPTERTKGVLVAPTIFGNLLAGPTAEDLPPGADTQTNTTVPGLGLVRLGGQKLCPALVHQPVIAAYAGLRCHCAQGSYFIRFNDPSAGIVTIAGIRSTGLSTSHALARHVVEGMADQCGLSLRADESAMDARPECSWPGWWCRPFDDAARLAERPDYGRIVCSCENISRGEILDAIASPLRPRTLDGLKRRTRALTGRCQGFNCCIPIAETIGEHCGLPLDQITKRGPGSEIVAGVDGAPTLSGGGS